MLEAYEGRNHLHPQGPILSLESCFHCHMFPPQVSRVRKKCVGSHSGTPPTTFFFLTVFLSNRRQVKPDLFTFCIRFLSPAGGK